MILIRNVTAKFSLIALPLLLGGCGESAAAKATRDRDRAISNQQQCVEAGRKLKIATPDYSQTPAGCAERYPIPEPVKSTGDQISTFTEAAFPWIIAGLVAIAVLWAIAKAAAGSAEQTQKAEDARLTQGRRIAEKWYDGEVQRVRAAQPQLDPSEYDPLGIGVAPPPQRELELPDPPAMGTPDLKRYAKFGRVLPWTSGTAIAAVMGRDGSDEKARTAWLDACKAANAGETDELGNFTQCARYIGLEVPLEAAETGDVLLRVMPIGLHIGERELRAAGAYLARTARVVIAHPFVREARSGEYWARLSMHATAPQQAQHAAPAATSQPAAAAAAAVDDDDPWS